MGLYRWIDYMSRTLIFQPEMKQDKKYKDISKVIFTWFLMIIGLHSDKALLWKGLLLWLFVAGILV